MTVKHGMEYGRAGGQALLADFYVAPAAQGTGPVLIAIHGGAWKLGTRDFYRHWGPWLAARGISVFAIDYRLVSAGSGGRRCNTHPAALEDVRTAIRFVRANASRLGVDGSRIALMGDSAGGHLAALAGLTGANDPELAVKAVIGVYGVYDMIAQWEHDLAARPRDSITEGLLGVSAIDDRGPYHETSPLTHAVTRNNAVAFLLAWGDADDVVDWASQSGRFLTALKGAGFFARPVPLAGAPHFWIEEPIDEPGSWSGMLAPRLLRFLEARL